MVSIIITIVHSAYYFYIDNGLSNSGDNGLLDVAIVMHLLIFLVSIWLLGAIDIILLVLSIFCLRYDKLYKATNNLVYIRKGLTIKIIVITIFLFTRLYYIIVNSRSAGVIDLVIIPVSLLLYLARYKISKEIK